MFNWELRRKTGKNGLVKSKLPAIVMLRRSIKLQVVENSVGLVLPIGEGVTGVHFGIKIRARLPYLLTCRIHFLFGGKIAAIMDQRIG